MPYIESADDLQWYREVFDGVWQSAVLRISLITVDDHRRIPNGELIFLHEPLNGQTEVLYEEGPLAIQEVVTDAPFDMLDDIRAGQIPIAGDSIDITSDLHQHSPSNYFQDGLPEGRVRETRPRTEVNAAINIEIPDDIGDDYSDGVDQLDNELKRAPEPYYDIGRCEGYYFDYISQSDRGDPKILLFADTGITFDINEDNKVDIVAPTPLFDDLFLSILPQHPYDEHKGWRIDMDRDQLETADDGRAHFTEDLDLEDIDKLYAILFLGERTIDMVEHHPEGTLPDNPRYQIMQAFDQANNLIGYLDGHNADYFEVAVVNAMSTAGWLVQWYGDEDFVIPSYSDDVSGAPYQEIDVIAYRPDSSQILFIECTNTGISNKEQILDRTEAISAVLGDQLLQTEMGLLTPQQCIPCIATPQSPEELNDDVVRDLEEKNITILHSERLKSIYMASQDTTDPVDADTEFIEFV